MKFRCERDVLVEALSSASRATSGRERLPVLAGARLEVTGDELRITATDLDLTIEVVATVAGIADGVCCHSGQAGVRHRARPRARCSHGRSRRRPGQDRIGPLAIRRARACRPTSSRRRPEPWSSEAVTVASRRTRRRAASGGAGGERATRPGRSSPACCYKPPTDGVQLIATDSYRLAVRQLPGVNVVRGEQKVLIPSRALAELQRVLSAAHPRSRCASARPRPASRSAP